MKKIAVIGSGISGLSCAYLLHKKYDITLFEKNSYLGGHSNTQSIVYNGKLIEVDTGFIVFNFRTYPNLKALFELLKIEIVPSHMSFGIKTLDPHSYFEYSGNNFAGLFAQKKNLFNPKFLKMLGDIIKFNRQSIQLIEQGNIEKDLTNLSLNDFVDNLQLGEYFKNYYLFPMAGAIWSCPLNLIGHYPAKTFLQFFDNHGLLTITKQPQWYAVKGGSKEYVKKISDHFKDKIKLNCNIIKAKKVRNNIDLSDDKNQFYQFDEVIFATHSNQTCKIIADKTIEEEQLLSKIKYSKNKAILHKDSKQMPNNKKAWASWVYLSKKSEKKVSLSYWMNHLQNIDYSYPLFVTLNPITKINQQDIFGEYDYEHPIFDHKAIEAQKQLSTIQGKRNIWFCGAWTKYGFHEDGLNSAISVAKQLGVKPEWKK